jgi:hypothetical protein
LIPQAPLHTDSLCDKAWVADAANGGAKVEVITRCHEQRVSNLMQALIIGSTLGYIFVLGCPPYAHGHAPIPSPQRTHLGYISAQSASDGGRLSPYTSA